MEVKSPAAVKRHYDITMSRRTRKQSIAVQSNEKPISVNEKSIAVQAKEKSIAVQSVSDTTTKDVVVSLETSLPQVKEAENDRKSLKQLIKGEEKDLVIKANDDGGEGKGRNSLGEHFTEEEKQLQLVRMQQKDNQLQGLKFKKLVRRYAKVLGHLMKAKRDPILGDAGKKPVFKLSS